MRVLMTGSSGFIGTALRSELAARGHTVARLVRRAARPGGDEVEWDPDRGRLPAGELEGVDAAVHLAGVGIGDRRWTPAHKQRVLDSRVRGTSLLSTTLARLESPPRVLVSASAMGYYGDRGNEILSEDDAPGLDFLARVCRSWEGETEPARAAGIRVVNARSSLVLDPSGGVFERMLLPFRLGLGARLGSGRQWWSWITLDDHVGALLHLLEEESIAGPVNLATPNPVTNAEFTQTLGRVLRRPAVLVAPSPVLRLALGSEMADLMVLVSQRLAPSKLLEGRYSFAQPVLEPALRALLRRTR